MTQKDKDLLLKDLCARLPHDVVVESLWIEKLTDVDGYEGTLTTTTIELFIDNEVIVKPYLRPISSMTEEEMDKLFDILHIDKDGKDEDWIKINDDLGIKFFFPTGKWIENVADAYDYLYSIHIDFRGLIPKGLAIEVNESNNPYKN